MIREAPPATDLAQSARRMGCIDVMAVSMSHSFAQTVAEFNIKDNPFHRISQWTGSFFQETSLINSTDDSSDFFQWSDTDDNIDDDYPEGPFIQPVRDSDRPAITVVDKSAFTPFPYVIANAPVLSAETYSSFKQAYNLECGTSAMNYYSKIRRLTSSIFPLMVPDRYRELMRAARQWRQCKLYKWHGFAHKDDQPKDGDLALFCPACPQTGYLVMDGNFKAEHMHPVNPSDEVSLMDGLGFMVSDERYKSHLAIAQDNVQRSDCNNHRAVNQANASRQRLEATGIGGCACARHGCFVPHSMVDFQKGERQMNMDYALSQALNYKTDGISRAITFYDINCQYNKYLKDRIASSMYLSIPIGMDIIPGIGLWHTERLWKPSGHLEYKSPSARGMGTPHRKEVLDYQMNDCNFMKMIRITKFLSRKFKEAIKGASESKLAFDNLNETANPDMVVLWKAEEALAHANRAEDPTAMDIYEVRLERGKCPLYWLSAPTKKQQELRLLQAQNRPEHPVINPLGRRGAATWLATGLTIEESQISLCKDVRSLRMHPTDMQLLRVARCRDKLHTQITSFLEMSPTYLGVGVNVNDPDCLVTVCNSLDDCEDYSDFDEDQNPDLDVHNASIFQPELTVIPLPSNIGAVRCRELGLTNLIKEEIALREGQANDALHAIRVHLGDKAVLFRNTVRSAKSQASSTRAWTRVRSVETAVNLHARIYSKCRSQLAKLPDHDLLKKYLPLKKEDLKASSAVADPNARGQRDTTLSWFWSLDVQGDTSGNDWMTEFYRVNWLRTKALRDRWNEEVILVKHEMQWSINFFTHRAKQWLCHMHNATSAGLTGHTCYAARQSHIYDLLAAHAEDAFRKMIVGIEVPVPAAYAEDALREMIVRIEVPVPVCRSHHSLIFLSMDNTVTLIPSNQVIIAAKGNHITAADISRALFYANSRMLAMRLYVDKSFATAIPGYAETFYTLMKWEMETFATPFINICFITRLSATIPQLLKDVLSTMTAHTLVDRRLDVNAILQDIRALRLSADSNKSDDYDIAHMPDYFNDWWKESLGCCRVSDMLPKSSVQDVMDLVEWHFSHLPDHVKTGLLPYIVRGPDNAPDIIGSRSDKDDES
ncbi:uncharacterized protein HD556DRAFT_1451631 [Suillus plorans]|uniref:CxC2-like cysteine cluster KDZ transposase-associated domain-containing protein n=1 Tax=Suillus plorans TaxID=116603 RepID=A0A9P7A8Y0_9AGAM|nr:uncharacterized protein HD556DRAFT_1451631 [Suillus plorans]KAG1784597.1 hypothetical protein HD556DRAFT_1451631 [Suillus plorans]